MASEPNPTFVALLRGINVAGRNRLRMAVLRDLFEQEGCSDVRTYIQSGNVVFRTDPKRARHLADVMSERIRGEAGLDVPIIVRSAEELSRVAAKNPFLNRDAEERALHVMFLADEPDPKAVADLDPERSPPDAFKVVGRHVYLFCPNGKARTKLTNDYFDRRLRTVSTSRNWRTVNKLLEMAGRPSA